MQLVQCQPMIMEAVTPRIQTVGSKFGVDWKNIWNIVQKLSPQLQEIILTILENVNPKPNPVQSGQPGQELAQANPKVYQISGMYGFDPSTLLMLYNILEPAIAQVITALLEKFNN